MEMDKRRFLLITNGNIFFFCFLSLVGWLFLYLFIYHPFVALIRIILWRWWHDHRSLLVRDYPCGWSTCGSRCVRCGKGGRKDVDDGHEKNADHEEIICPTCTTALVLHLPLHKRRRKTGESINRRPPDKSASSLAHLEDEGHAHGHLKDERGDD